LIHENELSHEKAKQFSDLFRKELSFEWKEEQHKAFENYGDFLISPNHLKSTLTQALSLLGESLG
jgi:hypothetical protein